MRPIISITIGLLLHATLQAATLEVPTDFTMIQDAVTATSPFDTVRVLPGTYSENITIDKMMVLVSSDGPEVTIIDGTGLVGGSLVCFNVDPSLRPLLDGFTLKNSVGEAAVKTDSSSPIIRNCIVKDNSQAGVRGQYTNTLVENCRITGNAASGIWFYGVTASGYVGSCEVVNCYIASNGEPLANRDASAVYNGGGIWAQGLENIVIRRCVVVANHALEWGGGLMVAASGNSIVENCTIAGNRVYYERGDQVTFYDSPNAMLKNSIVVGFPESPRYSLYSIDGMSVNVSYCDFWSFLPPYPANVALTGVGVHYVDPLFDPNSVDGFELLPTSTLIDAGDPTSPVPPKGGIRVDIGAHESSTCLLGDANRDGRINLADAVSMIQYIFMGAPLPGRIECSDVDGRCGVNVPDIVFLIRYIFAQGPAPAAGNCP